MIPVYKTLMDYIYKKVYNIIPEEYAIYCYPNSGPSFSNGSLHIPDFFYYLI